MPTKSGADIIARLIERQGVTIVPGIPGGANLPLYDALAASSIRHILTRHEQGAAFLAQGMARVSGKPAVCLATSGPGATNLVTAIADAYMDSIPLVCLTGQVPRAMIGTDAFQEVDMAGVCAPVCKKAYRVQSAAELLTIIPEAFTLAASGRPGPVVVDIPRDVQTETATFARWPEPGRPDEAPEACPEGIEKAARIINQAKRPILYLGGGAARSGAAALARRIMEKAAIPAVQSLMGLGVIPSRHPLSLGMLGMHASPWANLALHECDALIAVGARFDDRATGKVAAFCPEASVVHIDIDPGQIHKIKTAHVGLIADAASALADLEPFIEKKTRTAWIARIAALKRQHAAHSPTPGSPRAIIRTAAALAGETAIVVTDVGQNQMWTARHYPFTTPGRWLTSGGLGTMGFGLPAAIGATLAEPQAPVVLFCGDGGMLMNIQEMATAAEIKADMTVVLFDNGGLGLVRQQQDLFMGGRRFATDYRARVDFPAVARGFGWRVFDMEKGGDPSEILARAMGAKGPCLVRVPVDAAAKVYPMVAPGEANTRMIGATVASPEMLRERAAV
ncbi:biosynthetic-type acetolactate synthase large subunit [Desulfovibrio sulfodismutans]|uniref:Acetolactate synthase n=1 Tax=Desulfolutivibrio sulfodismutans TaxID=63561 RepID=A0A7K3NHQ5_9BACT|nr:biosynthetic-type acetolactate synthase large subunit [Desulfolutivibrio sulfodismutans]NDY55305.1 biosynthetic-type acetolactate synthase large subunit [Desulfolutivibrio sulfodismutans]QLA11007.1 biosynthetic-type acetolactate synthase large subunit [Desulfolutivibrio sulfodismutans DSM 3696]